MEAEISERRWLELLKGDASSGAGCVEGMQRLAEKWHSGVFRKGPGHLPYVVHPAAVVAMLRSWGYMDFEDGLTLSVAWGQDLLEDTEVPEQDVVMACGRRELGEMVLAGISMLTFTPPKGCDDAVYDKAKEEYIRRVAESAPVEILAVKIADRLSNTLDFVDLGGCAGIGLSREG